MLQHWGFRLFPILGIIFLPAGIIADVITTALEEAIEKETMTIGKTMENHRTQGGGALPGRPDSGRLQAGTQLEDSFLRGEAF